MIVNSKCSKHTDMTNLGELYMQYFPL